MTVTPERSLTVALGVAFQEPLVHVEPTAAYAALVDDERRWQGWCAEVDADAPHRDAVVRTLLTLRLLTYSPSGAPVAAPTTSLPEARLASATGTTDTPGPGTPASGWPR